MPLRLLTLSRAPGPPPPTQDGRIGASTIITELPVCLLASGIENLLMRHHVRPRLISQQLVYPCFGASDSVSKWQNYEFVTSRHVMRKMNAAAAFVDDTIILHLIRK